jgi:hypothetical protein
MQYSETMNRKFYLISAGIAFLFIVGWLIEFHYGHTSGQAMILQTTTGEESKRIGSELRFIAKHTGAIKWPKPDNSHSDFYALNSLHKVSIGIYTMDSSQLNNGLCNKIGLYEWRTRSFNAKLLSEPVYMIQKSIGDTALQ